MTPRLGSFGVRLLPETALIDRLRNARVAVIGDLMLDHFVYGAVQRISPEAPVPVLNVASERITLGGAANVAANVASLGGEATLVGAIGKDAGGEQLMALLGEQPRIVAELTHCATHPTVIKTRYLGDRQQIVRVDRERAGPFADETIDQILRRLSDAIDEADVVVLSDYGKGVLSDAVLAAAFKAAGAKPVIVDPKRTRIADYAGATFITPNRRELQAFVTMPAGTDEEAEAAAMHAIELCGASILLTRSEKGMSLFRRGAASIHLPTRAREVYDVSGAGDTVVAAFATALACGIPLEAAMELSNLAAGVVVGKLGTAVCTPAELRAAAREAGEQNAAVPVEAVTWDEAGAQRAIWRAQSKIVGLANGCFDLLHPGHIALVRQAAAQVDCLIMALNSDASVAALKGHSRPIQSQDARAAVMAGVKGVDLVVIFDQPTPLDLITLLQPDVLFKGADYAEADVVGGDVVKAAGGRVALIDLVKGQSTSALVKRMQG
jgi:D-beta-D-heptose 7-phosphate kinase/D-beta-D-heptose 1-phosphate adenosyltransferase